MQTSIYFTKTKKMNMHVVSKNNSFPFNIGKEETCVKCKIKLNLSDRKCTIHNSKWYHLDCWKELVGKF